MKVILARMPALDAALIRFDGWWNGLSRRERILLSVMAALLALVGLTYGVVKPLQAARAQAIADIRTYETLAARVRAAGTLAAAPGPRRTGSPEQIAQTTAAAFGIAATVAPVPGGARVAVADATYDALLAWIADLSATSDLRVRRVAVQRARDPGHVTGSVEFGQ